MSTKSSIPWNWVIEALANFEQVDISNLVGLVKKAPAISDDAGNNAREMVALRMLESLFNLGNEATVDVDSTQHVKRIRFDPSERCEDVLQKLLRETSEPMTESEWRKWDVRAFVMRKRSSLPTPSLKKLKDAVLEGRHPSLKGKSKLGVVNDISAPQTVAPNDDSPSSNRGNENELDQIRNSTGGIEAHTGPKECEMSKIPFPEDDGHVPGDYDREGHDKTASIDDVEDSEFVGGFNGPGKSVRSNASNGVPVEHGELERIDIVAEKEAFFSFRCTQNEDLMAMTESDGSGGMDLCVKCSEGGPLLVCGSGACPLKVHERCLGFTPSIDETGKFFCPFCAYSHAIPKYLEAKRKASMARKDLQTFLSSGVKSRNTGTIEANRNRDIKHRANTDLCREAVNDAENPVPVEPADNGPQNPTEEENPVPVEPADNGLQNRTEDQPPSSQPGSGSNGNVSRIGTRERAGSTKRPRPSVGERRCEVKENPLSSVSSYSKRLRNKGKPQYTFPAEPSLRRTILPWTKSEEALLKEGVEKFANSKNKWKEILEYAGDVFEKKGRTPIDLKDKWRNICSKGGSPMKNG